MTQPYRRYSVELSSRNGSPDCSSLNFHTVLTRSRSTLQSCDSARSRHVQRDLPCLVSILLLFKVRQSLFEKAISQVLITAAVSCPYTSCCRVSLALLQVSISIQSIRLFTKIPLPERIPENPILDIRCNFCSVRRIMRTILPSGECHRSTV